MLPSATGRSSQGAAIAGVAGALPPTIVSNSTIAAGLDVDDHWIVKRLGVHERRVIGPDERLDELGARAARLALERSKVDPGDLDMVLVATTTQDELLPNTAPLLATQIGARGAGAVDLGAACTGFLTGLGLGTGLIESGRADAVLVVGADVLSRFLDTKDRRTAALIGDGAGAVVLVAVEPPGRIGPLLLLSDAEGAELIYMRRDEAKLRMEGQQTYALAVRNLCSVTEAALSSADVDVEEIDLFVYHQANARILRAVAQRLALPPDRVVDCIARTGNTSAASIPLALDHALARGALCDGSRVLLAAIGAGFTWGATVLEWGSSSRPASRRERRHSHLKSETTGVRQ